MSKAQTEKPSVVVYKEVVRPSIASLSSSLLLLPAIWLVMAPFDTNLGFLLGLTLTIALLAIRLASSPRITVTQDTLTVAAASVDRKFLATKKVIASADQFSERGPLLDARAFVSFQSSAKGLVKINIKDAKDPTPYWLVSTRNPEVLLKALS